MIQSGIIALQNTDYAPFRQKNLLLIAHQKFCKKTAIDMQPILKGCSAVKIAINKVKIDYLYQNLSNRIATSVDEPLQTVLSIQFDRVSDALKEVDIFERN